MTAAQLVAAYGWLQDFRAPLQDWDELLQIVETTEQWVRSQGLSPGCGQALAAQVTPLVRTARGQRVAQHLLSFVETEAAKAAPHERFLGSSEVIESVFGKLKRLEQHHAQSGFTGLVLAVGALVSTTTLEVIQQALETVSTRQVRQWCQQHLGPSVQAQHNKPSVSANRRKKTRPTFNKRLESSVHHATRGPSADSGRACGPQTATTYRQTSRTSAKIQHSLKGVALVDRHRDFDRSGGTP